MPVRSIVTPTLEEVAAVAAPTGNTLLTIDMITREALRIFHENVAFVGMINRQYEEKFQPTETVRIRRSVAYGA